MSSDTGTDNRFDLTPRQREVMEMIVAGRTNPEIADALGVSIDGAKYHVREILSKLAVASREEAVEVWRTGRRRERQRWYRALGLGAGAAKIAGIAAAVVGVGAVAAVALIVALNSGDDDDVAPAPSTEPSPSLTATASASTTPSQTPTATPTPEVIAGIAAKPLAMGEPVALPDDVAVLIESGCWGCDGPAAALERVYRAPDGEIRTEDLFRIPGATITQPEVDGKYITSIVMERNATDILLAVCEGPYCGGVGEVADGATVSVLHSRDGGVSWENEATIEGGVFLVANLGGGPTGPGFGLMFRAHRPAPGEPYVSEFAYYPSLETEPIDLGGQDPVAARIIDPASGPHMLVSADGISLSRLEGATPQYTFTSLPAGSRIVDFQFPGGGLLVTWTTESGGLYTGYATNDGAFGEIFRWPENTGPFFHRQQGGFIDDRTWVVALPQMPAIVDFDSATIYPIAELMDRGATTGDRTLVKGVMRGPFARVTGAGEGDCLNVREQPSLSAAAFACYPDGVLLVEQGQRSEADGTSWVLVMAGDRQGWASAEFLETSGRAPSASPHPVGTRTGMADVDAIIAALEQSQQVPDGLIAWQPVPCETPPVQGIGGPPPCPEGVANGTPIDAISGAACEGYWRVRPDDGSDVMLSIGPEDRLYAVARPGSDYRPGAADYVAVYVSGQIPAWGKTVTIAGGKIMADTGGCGTSPSELLDRMGDVVFPPPP